MFLPEPPEGALATVKCSLEEEEEEERTPTYLLSGGGEG